MTAAAADRPEWWSPYRQGLADGRPFALVAVVVGATFGVFAAEVGLSVTAVGAMSALAFAAAAQFAVVTVVGAGGGVIAAAVTALLLNARFIPMGLAVGPSLSGGRWRRAVQGQAVIDASCALAARADGTFDRHYMFGLTSVQYPAWVLGSVVGSALPQFSLEASGLDAAFPTLFAAILFGELRSRRHGVVAMGGALLALATSTFLPPGLPVVAAAGAALLGLARQWEA